MTSSAGLFIWEKWRKPKISECIFNDPCGNGHKTKRSRKSKQEIVAAASRLAESGVHLIDLTMGEDPDIYTSDGANFDYLVNLIESLQKETGLPIMVSPGLVPARVLHRLDASASVVTSIVPPNKGLVGVAQYSLDIEDGRRTMASVIK